MSLSIAEYIDQVQSGTLSAKQATLDCLAQVQAKNPATNAVLRLNPQAPQADFDALAQKELAGLPMMIKDNILLKDHTVSCASQMLKDFKAPYTATCIEKLQSAGVNILGQTNMDEFAMGGANENSAFGACKNPFGTERIS